MALVYVVDSHPLYRYAVSCILKEMISDSIIIEFDSLISLSSHNHIKETPALICMEIKLIDSYGASSIRDVRGLIPSSPLVIISALPSIDYSQLSTQLGADLYIEKTASISFIKSTLRNFLKIELSSSTHDAIKLSRRQREILPLLEKGMTNRDIAHAVGIAEHTVKVHMSHLLKRLKVKNRSQACYLAKKLGLMSTSNSFLFNTSQHIN